MSVFFRSVALLLLAYSLLGCVESSREQATGKGSVRGLNALADSLDVNFRIEERTVGAMRYKDTTSSTAFDDLTYVFNYDIAIAGQIGADRIASITQKIVADNDYLFILVGSVATPEILVWDTVTREWEGTETVFEMAFGHVSPDLGTVDVYYAPTGTTPVPGNAAGSLSFGERLLATEFTGGEYELILTAPGDPATVLFQGAPSTPPNASTNRSVLFDADPSLTAPINVRLYLATGTSFDVPDTRFPPTTQLINAAFGSGNVDLVIDNDFVNPPIVSDLPFGMAPTDVEVPAGTSTFTYTPPASTTVLLEEDTFILAGVRSTIVLQGVPGNLSAIQVASFRRPVSTAAQLRIINASFNLQEVDIYVSAEGSVIGEILPIIGSLPFGVTSAFLERATNSYELTITTPGEKTVVAGPLTIALSIGDVVEVLILDTADPAQGDLLQFTNLPALPSP